jgi:prepilin-type N-terminal cleavage/methylation domain-containing protein
MRRYREGRATPRQGEAGVTLIEVLIAVTLLSVLSVAMLYALRGGLMAYSKTDARLMDNRRVAGAQRILEQELEGMIPVVSGCSGTPDTAPQKFGFFQGEAQVMRLVSNFSLQQAWRGQPKILELFVIPGENGEGVRLVVNETPYMGPVPAGNLCMAITPDSSTGRPVPHFAPVYAGPGSFVLADKLAFCRFSYLWPSLDPAQPLPAWRASSIGQGWPMAMRVEMAPLEADPSRLQPMTVTADIHIRRIPEIPYGDY